MKRLWRTLGISLFALLALGGSVRCEPGPIPLGDGRIQWGPFLLFGDDKGGLH